MPFLFSQLKICRRRSPATEHGAMMKKSIASSSATAGLLDLGVVLGQSQTFSLIAGRCSAAQAAGLHRLRKEKQYTRLTPHWSEFCTSYLKMSRSQVDHVISLYEEFGPAYFEVSDRKSTRL